MSATKSNAQQHAMTLWDEVVEEVSRDFPDVATERVLIDALAARFVLAPESLDVVVASNLFGDILTDLGAAICGSMGLAPSGNINPERDYPSMFEPVHGSAPDIVGKGIANPVAQIPSGAMMLEFLGEKAAAELVAARGARRARRGARAHARPRRQRPDLGGHRGGAGAHAAPSLMSRQPMKPAGWRAAAPLGLGLVLFLLPVPSGLEPNAWRYFALFAAVILGLILEPIPAAAIGLVGVTLAGVGRLVEPSPAASVAGRSRGSRIEPSG